MSFAPVVVFGYNRPKHLENTLTVLADNDIALKSEVFIFLDGKKEDDKTNNVEETYRVADTIKSKKLFKDTTIVKASENRGLATSIIDGVSEIIRRYGKIIVLEDDLITSKDFLTFMNEALEWYENNSDIWSISGFSQNISSLNNIKEDVYFLRRATSWGWATWEDRWNQCDWNVTDYRSFRLNISKRQSFNYSGNDLSSMLDRQMRGLIDSWAIRWCYSQYKYGKLTVFPKYSKIKNVGADGSGTNAGDSSDINHSCYHFGEHIWTFRDPVENKEIAKEFKSLNELSLKSRISRFIRYNLLSN